VRQALWILVVVAFAGVVLISLGRRASGPVPQDSYPPWRVDRLPDGRTRVFGLVPGSSTLQDALEGLGPHLEAAVFQSPEGDLVAEAYYPSARPGGISGHLVLILDLAHSALETLRDHSPKHERMGTGNIRYTPRAQDAARLEEARIRGMTFVPTADLDEEILETRFGTPAERVPADEHTAHWLYPERGLAITVNARGKEVLQYGQPSDFAWVRSGLSRAQRP
jgi:hypothetical protein